jgi:multidrug efflux pump subunit AcrA (membrane-fusion protein)
MKTILTLGGVLRVSLALLVVLGLLGGGLVVFLGGSSHNRLAAHPSEPSEDPEEPAISVKVVRPHYDKSFSMIEKRPADVLPYYLVPLDCRVAGEIEMIKVDKGSVVKKGDKLVVIKVPERVADRNEKEAALKLARAQVAVKDATIKLAKANQEAVETKIKAMEAKLRSDKAYQTFRDRQRQRYAALFRERAIDEKLVDEQEDRWIAAREAVIYTEQAVKEAEAQERAAKAKIIEATAEWEKAKQEVAVAEADRDRAQAKLDFATIRAPFDGVIVDRNRKANMGAIVQEADQRNPLPLLTIQSKDLVTVAVRVPDNFAPYITPDTEAIFETPVLPGIKIHGKVTRFPPSLETPERDRTMIVEVDLWTGSKTEFEKKMNDPEFLDSLKSGMNPPVLAGIEGRAAGGVQPRLLPGMFGYMTLELRHFENVYLLPSSAIDIQGGNQYIYVVKDGKAHHQRVKVQVDDGKFVEIDLLNEQGEVLGDLTGKEEVIITNLGELTEGQAVKPVLVENWRTLQKEKH